MRGAYLRDYQPVVDDHECEQPGEHFYGAEYWGSLSGGQPDATDLACQHPTFHHDSYDSLPREANHLRRCRKHDVRRGGIAAAAVQTAVAGWAGMQGGVASARGPEGIPPPPPPRLRRAARRRLRQKVVEVWAGAGFPSASASDLSESGAGGTSAPRPPSETTDQAGASSATRRDNPNPGIRLGLARTLWALQCSARRRMDEWEPGRARRAGR